MKRTFENIIDETCSLEHHEPSKVKSVKRCSFGNTTLVNVNTVCADQMDISDSIANTTLITTTDTNNHLDISGRQTNLQDFMMEVIEDTKVYDELQDVACNFLRKPGHVYHLYRKSSGQKYFSMLAPEEWGTPPHKFLGSWKLEEDNGWTELIKYKFESTQIMPMITNSELKRRTVDLVPI